VLAIMIGNIGLAGAAVVAVWLPVPALALGVAITLTLLLHLNRRGRRPHLAPENVVEGTGSG